jgi:hypothetical protein
MKLGFIHQAAWLGLFAINAAAVTHYVDLSSPSPTPPYTNWITAATNIQDAVDAANPGDTVLVTNGVYSTGGRAVYLTMTNRVAVDKAITLLSANGPTVTKILGGIQTRGVYVGSNAVVSGFTVHGGRTGTAGDTARQMSGGGIWCEFSGVVSNCSIVGNVASASGGGVYRGTLYRCVVSDNSAVSGGGGYQTDMNNCVVVRNAAFAGGGLLQGVLNNCTVTSNLATNRGGGTSSAAATNCIVYFNTAPLGPNWDIGSFQFSCTVPMPSGSSNITNDPMFVDWQNGLFQLKCGSPAIDAGVALADSADIRGAFRPIDGNEDGTALFDMGAYEFWPAVDKVPTINAGHANFATGFSVTFLGGIGACATDFWWDFGDGVQITNQNAVSHAWTSPGDYPVRLTANSSELGQSWSATTQVHVVEQQIAYVDQNNSTPLPPFVSWATAATNIQDAIEVAVQVGAMVLVTNGIYGSGGAVLHGQQTNRIALTNVMTVLSLNGPQATIIVGGPATRCAYVGSNASLSGFTLTNGQARNIGDVTMERSGGGVWAEKSGVITNCIIQGNAARWSGGGGAYGGTLVDCVIRDNRALAGAGVRSSLLFACTLSGNETSATGTDAGGGAHSSALYNCVLSSNSTDRASSYGSGGAAYQCLLSNCVVIGNSAAWNSSAGGTVQGTNYSCQIIGNEAAVHGGGSIQSVNVDCIIAGNSARFHGGGSYQDLNFGCSLVGNSAGRSGSAGDGGGSYQGTNFNCLIVSNSATRYGGGVYMGANYNCTIVHNAATNAGGFGGGAAGSQLFNSIIFFNSAASNPDLGLGSYTYNCWLPPAGEPGFVNTSNGNFRLLSSSPCINLGRNSYAVGDTDLDGAPRIAGHFPIVDIGAYEFQGSPAEEFHGWLELHGLPTDGSMDYVDTDADGANNWQEWIADTNPTNSLSALKMLSVASANPSGMWVSWQMGYRTYFLQRSTNLAEQPAFSTIKSNISALGSGTITVSDLTATNGGPYFYRVGVQ